MTTMPRTVRAFPSDTVRARAWVWLRAGTQVAALLLVAWALDANAFGRYATALAIAAMIAPLFVAGPAYVYLDSHPAFGCTRDQLATVWRRMLFVFGFPAALLVPLCMGALAGDWAGAGLWFFLGLAQVMLAGFGEMRARFHETEGEPDALGLWLLLPHLAQLAGLLALLAGGGITLPNVVALTFATTLVIALVGARRVPRKDAPRALDALARLLRTGLRFGNGHLANRIIADADKPFLARLAHPAAAGGVFVAQRVAELFCLPLRSVVASSLPRLLDAAPGERAPLWRQSAALPALYALFAGGALFAMAPLLERLGPGFGIAAAALRWMCWLPLLAFARGMLGNAAVVAGRHAAALRGQWFGAIARVAGTLALVSLYGWQGAIASLLFAELVAILYLALAMRPARTAA